MSRRLHQTLPDSVYTILIESAKKRGLTPSQLLILLITSYAPPVSDRKIDLAEPSKTQLANKLLEDLDALNFGE